MIKYLAELLDLLEKVRDIQSCNCSSDERKLFVSLIANSGMTIKDIASIFPELIKQYLPKEKLISKKQLMNRILGQALKSNNVPLARLAISEGAVVDGLVELKQSTKSFKTHKPLLVLAAEMGLIEMVKVLLDKGANIDIQNQVQTALTEAIENEHLEVAKLLIKRGANINSKNYNGKTALSLAIGKECEKPYDDTWVEIITMLLENDAEVNIEATIINNLIK